MKLKQLFLDWAYLDLAHTGDVHETYYARNAEEIGKKNMSMIRSLSLAFALLCVFVIGASAVLGAPVRLTILYAVILLLEAGIFYLSTKLLQRPRQTRLYTLLSAFYLLHLLVFGAYIGTAQSPDESASIFLVTLILTPILFTLPPLLTTGLSAVATAGTIIASYHIKSDFFFRIDLLNCLSVFLISLLVGWLVNKMRVEEATSRARVQQLNAELTHLSTTDQLTGLPNHRHFQETYYAMFEAAQETHSRVGIIMLDIDQFKAYNDNYGHVEGDKCLIAIGNALQACRTEDVFLCRFGGEEFVALLGAPVCDEAEKIAEDIRKKVLSLAIPHAFSRVAGIVTVSAGLYAGTPESIDAPMRFVDRADRAMYQSKADGGNRTTVYQSLRAPVQTPTGALTDTNAPVFPDIRTLQRKVLIVDDSEINRAVLGKILGSDYDVLEAENGRIALDILNRAYETIAVVLLDIVMPVMDGYEVLKQMRSDVFLAKIPVIVTTAYGEGDSETRALSLGANDFVVKPYNPAVIKHRVDNTIHLRESAALVNALERDELTNLYGKTTFCKKAEAFLRANDGTRYDVICCDIGGFHTINERFGEKTGDALLVHIANQLLREGNGICISGRVGTDQFACVIPHRDAYDDAFCEDVARRIGDFPPVGRVSLRCGVCDATSEFVPVSVMCERALIAANAGKGKEGVSFTRYPAGSGG